MASITCGNCKNTHGSVREVRECYGIAQPSPSQQAAQPVSAPPATEKQIAFLTKLCEERPMWADVENLHVDVIAKLSKRDASAKIEEALAVPAETKSSSGGYDAFPEIKAGRYAIDIDGTVKFYKVDRPTEGRWKGRTFVKVQASDELHQIRSKDAINAILKAIVDQGVNESLARYGQLLGSCGVCGRTLTDETSRELGIGPVCREGL